MNHVSRAVDRVDRPAPRASTSAGRVFLSCQRIVRESITKSLADQVLEVLIEVGDVAEVGFLLRRDILASFHGDGGGLDRQGFHKFQLGGQVGRISHLQHLSAGRHRVNFDDTQSHSVSASLDNCDRQRQGGVTSSGEPERQGNQTSEREDHDKGREHGGHIVGQQIGGARVQIVLVARRCVRVIVIVRVEQSQ